jgi:hypothetical protein
MMIETLIDHTLFNDSASTRLAYLASNCMKVGSTQAHEL